MTRRGLLLAICLGIAGTAGWVQSTDKADDEIPAKVNTWHNVKDLGSDRYALDNNSEYGWLICYAPNGATIKSIKVVYFSEQDQIPALAVKNTEGIETWYRPETTDELKVKPLGGGVTSLVLDSSIPADASQTVVWLKAGSDVEIRRVVVEYN